MAISFESLPQDKPSFTVPKGFYRAKVSKAEMKTPKSGGKDYLSVTYDLTDAAGKARGKFWDMFFDIPKDIPRYKLGRFMLALELNITGSFELRDLAKIINNKELVVDLTIDEKNDPPRNVVDVFSNEIYYPIREWASLSAGAAPAEAEAEGTPEDIDAPFDDDDADSPVTANEY